MNNKREALGVLDLGADADPSDVRKAYRELVQVWHPDRFPQGSGLQQRAQERLKTINAAYRYLREHPPEGTTFDTHARGSPHEPTRDARASRPRRKRRSSKSVDHLRLGRWVFTAVVATLGMVSLYAFQQVNRLMAPWRDLGTNVSRGGELETRIRYQASVPPKRSRPPNAFEDPNATGSWSLSIREPSDSADVSSEPMQLDEFESANERRFGLDATKAEVLAIQGPPAQATESEWRYGRSSVRFERGRVAAWRAEPRDSLRVDAGRSPLRVPSPRSFTAGWTKAQVLAAQGEPTRMGRRRWTYGRSVVFFENDRVSHWEAWPDDSLRSAGHEMLRP